MPEIDGEESGDEEVARTMNEVENMSEDDEENGSFSGSEESSTSGVKHCDLLACGLNLSKLGKKNNAQYSLTVAVSFRAKCMLIVDFWTSEIDYRFIAAIALVRRLNLTSTYSI